MNVMKRNGQEVRFDKNKIIQAITKANTATKGSPISAGEIKSMTESIAQYCLTYNRTINIEEIQDLVEQRLMILGYYDVAKNYVTYRYKQALKRQANTTDKQILSLIDISNEEVLQENSNKNPIIASTQRDYMAGEVSKDLTKRFLLPDHIWEAHEEGIIHFHDADYFAQKIHNCCLVDLEDMLQNGTVISGVKIDKPHSFSTACNIATQIIAQVASCQYGGQTITLTHLAPFVDISRQKIKKAVTKELRGLWDKIPAIALMKEYDFAETVKHITEERLKEEIARGVQTLQYQIITLMTTNGQAPFVTIYMDINEAPVSLRKDLAMVIEEVLNQRIKGVKNSKGCYITPAFPKLIYALDSNNVKENSAYFWLTKLAAKCTAKRMVPDYISRKKMLELKIDKFGNGNVYPGMGCRSFLTPYVDKDGKPKYYGRFNQGVVTLNLVDIACSSEGDFNKFEKIFDERLQLCYEALMLRHKRLLGTTSDISPIHFQHGALARLKPGEVIDPLLFGGYSTISLGYAGLYECTKYMTGESHTQSKGHEFAIHVMERLNEACKTWKAKENIDFSLYGTPIESTTYKFAKKLQQRFGIIPEVTDHNYITNSYHVNVREEIDAFSKLSLESEFQHLSPGGAISYVEVPNMESNISAVLTVLNHIYDTIIYAELNTKSDYCHQCGYEGEIEIVEDDNHKLIWRCPNCGNTDQRKMNVARRTCGYIGSNYWNQGRTQEIKERVLHL